VLLWQLKFVALFKARESQGFTLDFFTAIKVFAMKFFPKYLLCHLVKWLFFYYGFYKLKEKKIKENEFTYHKIVGHQHYLALFIIVNQ
jgi:hypothetical protein